MSTSVNQGVNQANNLEKSLAELQQLHSKIEYVVDSSEKNVQLIDKKLIELDSLTK
jgi:t-SNARE complex subunit (syntaxin)